MSNTKINEILKLLMFKKDIRTAELAREVNIPQQTLQRIVSGMTPNPHMSTLVPLARYFSISIEQLRGLEPISGLEISPSYSNYPGLSSIAIIQWTEVTQWQAQIDQPTTRYDKIFTDAQVGPKAFALRTKDSSMSPIFPENTILVVDPEKEAKDRQYVVVKLRDQMEATFRQLLVDLGNFYIKPLSPDFNQFPMIKLTPEDKICGVVVQARRDYLE